MTTVSQAEFAKIIGKSPQTISVWLKDGLPVATLGKPGRAAKVDTAAAIDWMIERATAKSRPAHSDPRNALYEEQRRKVWLENEATELQMVKLDDVQVVINEAMVAIASELEGMPGRMAGRLAGITEPALVRQALRVEITNIRQAAADRLSRLGAIAPSVPDPAPAAVKKSRSVGKRKKNTAKGKRRARPVSE